MFSYIFRDLMFILLLMFFQLHNRASLPPHAQTPRFSPYFSHLKIKLSILGGIFSIEETNARSRWVPARARSAILVIHGHKINLLLKYNVGIYVPDKDIVLITTI